MEDRINLVVFYSFEELDIKDVETDLYTEDKNKFQFFFFHNKNLHFNKEVIENQLLIENFKNISPVFNFTSTSVTMTKKINNFNFFDFSNKVELNYNEYLKRITYRIDCIFQTFNIFNNLYIDKNIIYIMPSQINSMFNNYIKKTRYKIKDLKMENTYLKTFDTIYWINYYSKFSKINKENKIIQMEDITSIYKIET